MAGEQILTSSIIGAHDQVLWGVKQNGKVQPFTLNEERKHAMGQALVTLCEAHVNPCSEWTDEQMDGVFNVFLPDCEVVKVHVQEMGTPKGAN